jgi:NAD(P)-dependent dehydrogenase (short-subunit alcohol dehydrogenase family)
MRLKDRAVVTGGGGGIGEGICFVWLRRAHVVVSDQNGPRQRVAGDYENEAKAWPSRRTCEAKKSQGD